jgi:hypothetical protein
MFGSSLPPVVCRRADVLLMMFGSSLPPVVCRRADVLLMMFGSSLPPVVCRRADVSVYIIYISLRIVVSNVVMFLGLFFFVLCTICCKFLWFVHLWLPLRYSLTFIYSDWSVWKSDCCLTQRDILCSYIMAKGITKVNI